MTEWGFMEENPSPTQAYLNRSADALASRLSRSSKSAGADWVAAWWDTEWEPSMLLSVGGYPGHGQSVLEQLKGAGLGLPEVPRDAGFGRASAGASRRRKPDWQVRRSWIRNRKLGAGGD